MLLDGRSLALLAAALGVMQLVCWALARGLGLRLGRGAVAAGLLLPFVLLAPWLAGSRLLVPSGVLRHLPGLPQFGEPYSHDLQNDAVYQLIPWELEVRHALAERRQPLWSDRLDGGSSPWANPQAGALSPIAMPARALPIQHHLLATLVLKLLVACQGAFLLARTLGASRAAALLAGAGFALGGGIAAWAIYPITAAAAWVPWVAAGAVRTVRRPRPRRIAATAVATAFLLLSGHPETAALGGLFAALCGLAYARRGLHDLGRGVAGAALAALLGFGLAAPHLLPFLSLVPDSQRSRDMLAEAFPAAHPHPLWPPSWFVPGYAAFVLAPVNPHAFGRPFEDPFTGPFHWLEAGAGYAGLVAFAGALAALATLISGCRRRRALPLIAFAALSLLVVARWLPLAWLFHAVPLLRVPAWSRLLPVVALALAVAAAFGIDRLLAAGRRVPRAAWVGVAVAAVLSLSVRFDPWVVALWALLLASVLAARWRRWAGAAGLGAVLLLDLVPWARRHLPEGRPDLFYPPTPATTLVAREAGPAATGRAVGAHLLIYPSTLAVYGVADVRPHNPLAPAAQLEALDAAFGFSPDASEYFGSFGNVDHPLLDFLNVRAVIGSIALPRPRTLERLDDGSFEPFQVYRNPDALPRWFLTGRVRPIERHDLRRWIVGLDDPRRVAVFADEVGARWSPSGTVGEVTAVVAEPGRLLLSVGGAGERLLATSIPRLDGWRAEAAGRRLDLITVNGAFLGVRVPPGDPEITEVELRYLPPGLVTGAALALVSALAVAGLWLYRRPKRRSSSASVI